MLAITAILASIVTPPILETIEQKTRETEDTQLKNLSTAFFESVKAERLIPGTDWVTHIAPYAGLNTEKIRYNSRDNQRLLLIDPNFFASLSTARPSIIYDQDSNGPLTDSDLPIQGRLILISSLGPALPSADSIDFSAVWNAEEGTLPSYNAPWDSWSGQGEDLRWQRISFTDRFHQVFIQNVNGVSSPNPVYQIESRSSTDALAGGETFYVLGGTWVKLLEGTDVIIKSSVDSKRDYYYNELSWTTDFLSGASGSSWLDDITQQFQTWVDDNGHTFTNLNVEIKQGTFEVTGN